MSLCCALIVDLPLKKGNAAHLGSPRKPGLEWNTCHLPEACCRSNSHLLISGLLLMHSEDRHSLTREAMLVKLSGSNPER